MTVTQCGYPSGHQLTMTSLLDNLDEELLLELDEVVRDNQLARCPFARSGRADLLLHERYPELASDIDEERQRRVREMAYKVMTKEEEKKISSSFKARIGSLDDISGVSLTPDKARQKSRTPRNEPFSPDLRPKNSQADLMFDMDEDASSSGSSPSSPCPKPLDAGLRKELDQLSSLPESSWKAPKGKSIQRADEAAASPPTPLALRPAISSTLNGANKRGASGAAPWAAAPLPTSKLGLQDIMNESKPSQSALSAELAAEKKEAAKLTPQKLSQKERKKFLQQQAEEAAREEAQAEQQRLTPWIQVDDKKGSSPWKSSPAPPKSSIKDVLSSEIKASSSLAVPGAKPLVVAESSGKSTPRRTASPDTRFPGQNRSGSAARTTSGSKLQAKSGPSQVVSPSPSSVPENKPLVPHSKSYIQRTPKQSESLIGLGLADIIDHQRREQESVKEAVAKRSLQEIQEEQAFQEWWDQESRRTQEEEARRVAREKDRGEKNKAGAGNSRRKGRGGKPKDGAVSAAAATATIQNKGGRGGNGVTASGPVAQQVAAGASGNGNKNGHGHTPGRGRGRGQRTGKA